MRFFIGCGDKHHQKIYNNEINTFLFKLFQNFFIHYTRCSSFWQQNYYIWWSTDSGASHLKLSMWKIIFSCLYSSNFQRLALWFIYCHCKTYFNGKLHSFKLKWIVWLLVCEEYKLIRLRWEWSHTNLYLCII